MTLLEIINYTLRDVLKDRPIQAEERTTNRGLVKNAEVQRMLDDAQDDLASESHCLIDQTTVDLAVYNLVDGQSSIVLNPFVLSIYDDPVIVMEDGSFRCLHRTRPRSLHLHAGTIPQCFFVQSGITDNKTVHLTPSVSEDNLQFKAIVAHRPVLRFSSPVEKETSTVRKERLSQQCHIPSDFHERLADYVLWKSTTHRDVDKNARRDSDDAMQRWYDTKLNLKARTYRLHSTDDAPYANPQF